MGAPPCQRKGPRSSPKNIVPAKLSINQHPLSRATHAPRPLTPPTHHLPVGKRPNPWLKTPGSGVAQPRPSCTAGGRPGDVYPPYTPPTPTPPTTSNPQEMQRPVFFFWGCSESLREQGLTCLSGREGGYLRLLQEAESTSASSSFLPDRRFRQRVVMMVAEDSALRYLTLPLLSLFLPAAEDGVVLRRSEATESSEGTHLPQWRVCLSFFVPPPPPPICVYTSAPSAPSALSSQSCFLGFFLHV